MYSRRLPVSTTNRWWWYCSDSVSSLAVIDAAVVVHSWYDNAMFCRPLDFCDYYRASIQDRMCRWHVVPRRPPTMVRSSRSRYVCKERPLRIRRYDRSSVERYAWNPNGIALMWPCREGNSLHGCIRACPSRSLLSTDERHPCRLGHSHKYFG